MIWALLAMYFFNGFSATGAVLTSRDAADLQERVAALIKEDSRRQSAKEILAELRSVAKGFEKSFKKSGTQLNRLYEAHTDNRQQALAILEDLNRQWEAGQTRALDARFALRDQLTETEWAALFGNE